MFGLFIVRFFACIANSVLQPDWHPRIKSEGVLALEVLQNGLWDWLMECDGVWRMAQTGLKLGLVAELFCGK